MQYTHCNTNNENLVREIYQIHKQNNFQRHTMKVHLLKSMHIKGKILNILPFLLTHSVPTFLRHLSEQGTFY